MEGKRNNVGTRSTFAPQDIDTLCVNSIRFLSVDAVEKAKSGHPGMPMGAAPMAYILWTCHLKHSPSNPGWFDRDRFVLSAGHASMLLYSLLHLTGYDLPLEQIQRFRQWGSITPGHPERGLTPGVEVSTGPLGQGFGNGVGLAIAEAHLAARFNEPGHPVIDHRTYGIVSDGDLMEGISSEAASLAGHLQLGKLVYLYDDNRVSLSAGTRIAFTEDVGARFEAFGWHVQKVEDGNDLASIDRAIRNARAEEDRPSLVIVRTEIGYGAPHKEGTFEVHGSPLGPDETRAAKERLGWPVSPPFHLPPEALGHFREAVERGRLLEKEWVARVEAFRRADPGRGAELDRLIRGGLPSDWGADIPSFPADAKGIATRAASGRVMQAIAKRVPELLGGSADLDPSTHTQLKGHGDFEEPARAEGVPAKELQGESGGGWSRVGKNLHFGVREHAMGSILNGIAAHGGLIPFGSTFLVFSDYMRPPIRLAALQKLHVIYVFTHDSIAIGEDGPTHQPVEQLAGLRAIPRLITIRPCDANETAAAWRVAIEERDRPVALVLSRQDVPILDRSRFHSAEGVRRGAYVLLDPEDGGRPDLILIGTGSEVALCVEAARRLGEDGVRVRVVSMPSWNLFEEQPAGYRDQVLPPDVGARLAVEAGSPFGWRRWVGDRGDVLGVRSFGASAPGEVVLHEYGFTADEVRRRALELSRGKIVTQTGGERT